MAAIRHLHPHFCGPLIFPASIAPSPLRQMGQRGTGSYWFKTTGFAALPAFTRRADPWYYDGLLKPGVKNMDLPLARRVSLTERFRLQFGGMPS
jgi:hypothetical protein